jgi:hypothetical protein
LLRCFLYTYESCQSHSKEEDGVRGRIMERLNHPTSGAGNVLSPSEKRWWLHEYERTRSEAHTETHTHKLLKFTLDILKFTCNIYVFR